MPASRLHKTQSIWRPPTVEAALLRDDGGDAELSKGIYSSARSIRQLACLYFRKGVINMDKKQIKNEIEHISELLYQQNIGEAYAELAVVIPRLEAVLATYEEDVKAEFADVLRSALDAMEQQDLTLLGDILQYEIIERLDDER